MTARKMLGVSLAILFATSLSAAQTKPVDLTGTWTGTLTRSGGEGGPAHIVLKQKDSELTGTAGPGPDRQVPITKGKVTTVRGVTSASFESPQPSGAVMKFDLQMVDGRLKGNVTLERDGQTQQGTIDVGREK